MHLSRQIDVLRAADRQAIAAFARRFGDRVTGFVVHDRADMPGRLDELEAAASELSDTLERSGPARLFIEYAAGSEAADFIELGRRLAGVKRVGVCLDTGHLGIRTARRHFAREHPDVGDDLLTLGPDDPRLPRPAADMQAAVGAGLTAVVESTRALAGQGKPVHYHLHDGHPLVPGLADHLSFLTRLPVPFEYQGRRSLDPLYGPTGLAAIVRTAAQTYGPERVSFTLEIHQSGGRLPLWDAARSSGTGATSPTPNG